MWTQQRQVAGWDPEPFSLAGWHLGQMGWVFGQLLFQSTSHASCFEAGGLGTA